MQAGDTIGTYQLETPLFDGVDTIWAVRHLATHQSYQLDIQPGGLTALPDPSAMQALSSLKHENICSIIDYGTHRDYGCWTVTRMARGMSLRQVLEMRGLPPHRISLELSFIIARAVEAAHELGLPHGHLSLASCYWDGEKLSIRDWITPFSETDEKRAAIERDIEFLATLVTSMMSVPPAPVRSLVESKPKTSGAYRRALAASLGAMPSSNSSTLLSSPSESVRESVDDDTDMTIETDSPLPMLPDWPSSQGFSDPEQLKRTQPIDPIGKTDEHSMTIGMELWKSGVGKAREPGAIDGGHSTVREVKAEMSDDSWGVRAPQSQMYAGTTVDHDIPAALRVHTVAHKKAVIESADTSSRRLPSAILITLLLVLVIALAWFNREQISEFGSFSDSTKTKAAPAQKNTQKTTTFKTALSANSVADAGSSETSKRWFEIKTHVAASVTRATDNVVVCKVKKICKVELYPNDETTIDTDYRISRPKYQTKLLRGYEIFDLRRKGSMRVVLQKK